MKMQCREFRRCVRRCANGNKEVYDPGFVKEDTVYNLHSVRRERGIDSETIGQYTTEHNVDTVESITNAGECVRSPDGLNAVGNIVVQEEESFVNMTETDDTSSLELMDNTDGVSDSKGDCIGISGIDGVRSNTSGIWDNDVFPESTDEAPSDQCGNNDITKGDTQDLMEFSGYASDKCVQRSNATIIEYDGRMGSLNGLSASKVPNTEYDAPTSSRFVHNPGIDNSVCDHQVIKNIQETKGHKMTYQCHGVRLTAYSDVDHGGNQQNNQHD